jgi:sRNA-binding protein
MSSCAEIASRHHKRASDRLSTLLPVLLLAIASASAPAQQAAQRPMNAAPAPSAAPAPQPAAQPEAKKPSETNPIATMPPVTDPRQEQVAADTQKLLKLSQELKAEVAKSSKDTLSLTVIKKAEEVETLAKKLKDELGKSR